MHFAITIILKGANTNLWLFKYSYKYERW